MATKKIDFLKYIFAVMKDKNIEFTSLEDIVEIFKIIFQTEEFSYLADNIHVKELKPKDLLEHENVRAITDDGKIIFSIDDEEKNNLLNTKEANLFKSVIEKYLVTKRLTEVSNGRIMFENDVPDGEYNLKFESDIMNEQGIRLFTDGNVKVINKEKGIFTGSRDVEIINSTFTLMVEYTNKNVDAIEIRGLSIGNYEVIAEDAIALLYNQNAGFISNIGYKELDKEKPKVYILKKH